MTMILTEPTTLTLSWSIFIDRTSHWAASEVATALFAQADLAAAVTACEPYHKGGFKVQAETKHAALTWADFALIALRALQRVGLHWQLSCDIDVDLEACAHKFRIANIDMIHAQALPPKSWWSQPDVDSDDISAALEEATPTSRDERATDELCSAAYDADLAQVERCLAVGLGVDERDERDHTALAYACLRGRVGEQLPVVKALLEAGADPNAVVAGGTANCLMLAAQVGADDIVRALAEAGSDVNAPVDEVTPLMVAARHGVSAAVACLLNLGANPGLKIGSFSAADYAWRGGHDELAELLRRLAAAGFNGAA